MADPNNPFTGNQVPTGSGSGVNTSYNNYNPSPVSPPNTNVGGQPASTGGWGSTIKDPNLWAALIGAGSAMMNRPKDGKFISTPMPPEVRALMQQYINYAQNSPTRNYLAPVLQKMMLATGMPSFQMTGLIQGPGIPMPENGQPWTYRSGGTPQQLDTTEFRNAFADFLGGKAGAGSGGPRNLANAKGPAGNPIGGRGRVMAGGKNKDTGEWQAFNWETGGSTGYDRANSGMGSRDEFGMVNEKWKQTALQNPDFAQAYNRYNDWLSNLPPDQLKAEMAKQAEIEAKIKSYGKAAITQVLLDPTFYLSLASGTTGLWAINKLKGMAIGVAKNEAGQWALEKTNNNPAVKALIMLANNMGTIQQVAGVL